MALYYSEYQYTKVTTTSGINDHLCVTNPHSVNSWLNKHYVLVKTSFTEWKISTYSGDLSF